jgi:hypothetical protein
MLLAAFAVSPIAWHFRPLTATERLLLGSWRNRGPTTGVVVIFTADRRYQSRLTAGGPGSGPRILETGSWRASGTDFIFRADPTLPLSWNTLSAHLNRLVFGNGTLKCSIELHGQDEIKISGPYTNTWDREPNDR